VDDISRTGTALQETVEIVQQLGARVIGAAVIVRFRNSPARLEIPGQDSVPILSLVDFDAKWYDSGGACTECKRGAPEEHVRF
jgi:adenine/guanine phosphoribosyltransferase-like PRPP-binding protein